MSGRTDDEGVLRFSLLGPVRAWRGAHELELGAPRQRSVAAALLLRAGRGIPRGHLVQAVWGEQAPAYAVNQLQKYVSALRRTLEPGRQARTPAGILTWSDSGYTIEVEPDAVDLTDFERGVGRGRAARARGETAQAAAELHRALGLWRGPALANVSSGLLDAERDRLEELRAAALEERVQADLDLGRHRALVPELSRLTADFPLREGFTALLMLALYRSGRQSDALSVYRRMRHDLREALGADPGGELQELHGRILAAEPSLDVPPAPAPLTKAVDVPPSPAQDLHQLPMDLPEFIGRESELTALREAVGERGTEDGAGGVAVVAIEGMAGAGKTRLAVHAAHRFVAAGRFTDVQLWADLLGFAADRAPADPAQVLEDFLRLLGVPGPDIPERLEARAALYRARLAGRRALVVLDDAADEEQVRHLLPGDASCLVLVTSRRVLTGLDGALPVRLGGLAPDEAAALVRRAAGREGDGDGSDELPLRVAELCGHLPLAVALAGRRLRTRPAWSMADLAERLESGEERLRRLSVGKRAVDAAFGLSYRSLSPGARRAFRLLVLHPGDDCTPDAAAALLGTDRATAEDVLEALLDEHLLEQHTAGRYRYHALLRLYARERLLAGESEEQRTAAVLRLVRWYCGTAEAVRHHLDPARRQHAHHRAPQQLPTHAAGALGWLTQERGGLLAISNEAARRSWHAEAARLAAAAHSFLGLHAYGTDSLTGLRLGLTAAREARDHGREARLLCDLGLVYDAIGRHPEAEEQLRSALARFEELGDTHGAAEALCGLGHTSGARGRYQESRERHGRALSLFRETGDRHGEARATAGLGLANWFVHDTRTEAAAQHRTALTMLRETGDRRREAQELAHRGLAHWFYGNYPQCARDHRRALALFEEADDRRGQAMAHHGIGLADWHMGRPVEAGEHHQYALATFRDLCDRRGEALTLQRLGYVHWCMGRYEEGERELRQALTLCAATGNRGTEAWAHTSLGHLYQRLRRNGDADSHLHEGLALARAIGDRHPESSALLGLALVRLNQGELDACEEGARQALALSREIGNPHGEAWAMIGRGLALCFGGRHEAGIEWHRRAAAVALRIGEPHTEAMALNGIGYGCTQLGRHAEAEQRLRAALASRRRILDRHGEAETLTDLAALLHRTGRPAAARTDAGRSQSIRAHILPGGR
ncbi:BTAD domain-containing putative transcriptional regulator [Streptomyces sp. NPDC059002]|uniref:BTAD domain-containing putative transcriptional regulator n=1 Tax=Streptomyces sp. NPDC059002 TaxID=3346690 RepID=UPI00368E3A87